MKALPYLKKGLEMSGTQYISRVYSNLAKPYLIIGDFERAEKYFKKSLELEVSCEAIGEYCNLMLNHGKFQEALQFADSICQLGQCSQVCARQLSGISLLQGEYEKAEQYFNQWQNYGPEHRFADHYMNYQLGYVYYQLGKTNEADKVFSKEIQKLEAELDMDRKYSSLHLFRIYAFKDDRAKALKYLKAYAKGGFTWGWQDRFLVDPLIGGLRDDPEFKAIIKNAKEEKAGINVSKSS